MEKSSTFPFDERDAFYFDFDFNSDISVSIPDIIQYGANNK